MVLSDMSTALHCFLVYGAPSSHRKCEETFAIAFIPRTCSGGDWSSSVDVDAEWC